MALFQKAGLQRHWSGVVSATDFSQKGDRMRDGGRRGGFALGCAAVLLAGAVAAQTADPPLIGAVKNTVKNKDQPKVRELLRQRVDVNARSGDGSTALLWAAHWNDMT